MVYQSSQGYMLFPWSFKQVLSALPFLLHTLAQDQMASQVNSIKHLEKS